MTYEEALHRLTNTLCEGCKIKNPTECSICHEAEDMMDELVMKADKYAWHDRRKNPEDLPPKPRFGCKGYIVKQIDIGEPFSAYWNGRRFVDVYDEPMSDIIIAWREIEPFKSEV